MNSSYRTKSVEGIVMLSTLELEIVHAIALGLRNSEIAGQLGLSHAAVREQIQEIMSKLNLTCRLELILLVHAENSRINLGLRAAHSR